MKFLYCIFLVICVNSLSGQEVCDNGIDDDNDGFIDLNDDDCVCNSLIPSSLIPNPSFEERTCCPMSNARLDCAVGWIQASQPTTDYVHTCGGYLGNTNIPAFAPLPFPDGEGGVGFRDGQSNVGSNYKEYVGACLVENMKVGEEYKLEFYVGFQDNVTGSKNLKMAIFASTACNTLPFGNNSTSIGCPANTGLFDELGELEVSGSGEWVLISFTFVPTKPYATLVLGPSCDSNPNFIYDPYFYLDGLTVAESSLFGLPYERIEGNICNEGVTLSIEGSLTSNYQWFFNGVAIVGATNSSITLTGDDEDGQYTVMVTDGAFCNLSQTFNLVVPKFEATVSDRLCKGDTLMIAGLAISTSGEFVIPLVTAAGCDSIVLVSVIEYAPTFANIAYEICEGEILIVEDMGFSTEGQYEIITTNVLGCDSTITMYLEVIDNDIALEVVDEIEVELGEPIRVEATSTGVEIVSYTWLTHEEVTVSTNAYVDTYVPLYDQYLYLTATDKNGCALHDSVYLRVDDRRKEIFFPNIFSPNEDNINDRFGILDNPTINAILRFEIYDRWGNLVYNGGGIENFWDGTMDGTLCEDGVYVYLMEVSYIDATHKVYTGDITLIK